MRKQTKILAYMNHGRWLIKCPKCSTPLHAQESGVVCPRCHPGVMAKALQQIGDGLFRPVADIEIVEAARKKAEDAGELYVPDFPPQRNEIERILRMRPGVHNMNWIPSETLDDLRKQNIKHGDPLPDEE